MDPTLHDKILARAREDRLYVLCREGALDLSAKLQGELTAHQQKLLEDMLFAMGIMQMQELTCAYELGREGHTAL